MIINYPLASDTWNQKEIEAINRVIASNRFSMGNEVAAFEQEFADYFGSKYAVMVNSGSSANLIAVAAVVLSEKYGLSKGYEVIVPAVSWATTYTPLHQYGLKLRFVDIDRETLNIDLDKLEEAITDETKAVFAVNLLGNPNEFDRLEAICQKYNLILMEDNCESMGAKYKEKYTGTFGVFGTFSTFYSHHMATMEGGMILTGDDELYEIMVSIRSHGWTRNLSKESKFNTSTDEFYNLFNFVLPGYNVRPIEMEAAIGREQLQKLEGFLENRRKNGKYFEELIAGKGNISTQKNVDESSYFGFPILFNTPEERTKAVKLFGELNIECRPIVAGNFTRNEVIKFFDYSIYGNLENSDKVHDCGLFIGNHHFDCVNQIKNIVNLIK